MIIRDFEIQRAIGSVRDLEHFMAKRYRISGANVNSFWMRHETDYPALAILVRDDLAKADYLLPEGGFASVGTVKSLKPGEMSIFCFDGMPQEVINDAVISCDAAVQIAKEFFSSKDLPSSIEWRKL
jgi:hypothetical protein